MGNGERSPIVVPAAIFGTVWAITRSLIIAGVSTFGGLWIISLAALVPTFRSAKSGEPLPGSTWDGTQFRYRPVRKRHRKGDRTSQH